MALDWKDVEEDGQPERYQKVVFKSHKYLEGDVEEAVQDLKKRMERLSDRHKFEEAAVIRDSIELSTSFGERQLFINRFASSRLTITDKRTGKDYIFLNGNLISPSLEKGEPLSSSTEVNEDDTVLEKRELVDLAIILNGYLVKEPDRFTARFESDTK